MQRLPIHRRGQPRPQRFALLDDADYMRLSRHVWFLDGDGYVQRQEFPPEERPRKVYLAREVLGLGMARDGGAIVLDDHRNGDPLDNRRENLRVVNRAENNQNRRRRGGSSRHRGVSFNRRLGRWTAYGTVNGCQRHLGVFASEEEAAGAARRWRREHLPFAVER